MYVTFSISVFNCGLSIFNKRILLLLLLLLLLLFGWPSTQRKEVSGVSARLISEAINGFINNKETNVNLNHAVGVLICLWATEPGDTRRYRRVVFSL